MDDKYWGIGVCGLIAGFVFGFLACSYLLKPSKVYPLNVYGDEKQEIIVETRTGKRTIFVERDGGGVVPLSEIEGEKLRENSEQKTEVRDRFSKLRLKVDGMDFSKEE